MPDIGTEFTEYLKAYSMSDFCKLDRASITDAEINSIFARHKANFDAWRKIPNVYKDAYGRAAPYMLEKAKNDPNFTEADARAAREEHRERNNFYSPIPLSLSEHPVYHDFIEHGVVITPAHAAYHKLAADRLLHKYSLKNANIIAGFSLGIKVLNDEIAKIDNNPDLSPAEKGHKKEGLRKEKAGYVKGRHDARIEANKEDRPEESILRLLIGVSGKKYDQESSKEELDTYIRTVIEKGRLVELAKTLHDYAVDRLKPDSYQFFQDELQKNGVDLELFEKVRSSVSYLEKVEQGDQKQHPASSQNEDNHRTAQIAQIQNNMRGR